MDLDAEAAMIEREFDGDWFAQSHLLALLAEARRRGDEVAQVRRVVWDRSLPPAEAVGRVRDLLAGQ